jgi:hypothetical protein
LDGDNRGLPDSEVTAEGLTVLRWRRYEAESYLVHPMVLTRFATPREPDLFSTSAPEKGLDFLREELPPAVLRNPLGEHDYLNVTPASKTLLPAFFQPAGISITKNEYYQIAAQMLPEEIPAEVSEKLDLIERVLAPAPAGPVAE